MGEGQPGRVLESLLCRGAPMWGAWGEGDHAGPPLHKSLSPHGSKNASPIRITHDLTIFVIVDQLRLVARDIESFRDEVC